MRKIRILYIHHGGFKGGAPRSLAFLIEKLDKNKFEPIVLCNYDFNDNKELFESVGASVYKENICPWHGSYVAPVDKSMLKSNVMGLRPTFKASKHLLTKYKPDLVHLNSTCLCFVAYAIKRINANIPVVCHVREPLLPGFWGVVIRHFCNKSVDQYIAIDQFDANSLKTKLPISIIYNFVDLNVYNPLIKSQILKTELGLSSNTKIILYLARISEENGALEAIESLKGMLKRRSDIAFCLVGAEDAKTDYFGRVAELSRDCKKIFILNFRTDVTNVISSSNLMIVPFQRPHFARCIIEASSMGIPSIATNVSGVNELIVDGETGYLVDKNLGDSFSELCERVLDNDDLSRKLGENARKFAETYFDATKNAQKTFSLYEQLLNEDRR